MSNQSEFPIVLPQAERSVKAKEMLSYKDCFSGRQREYMLTLVPDVTPKELQTITWIFERRMLGMDTVNE